MRPRYFESLYAHDEKNLLHEKASLSYCFLIIRSIEIDGRIISGFSLFPEKERETKKKRQRRKDKERERDDLAKNN